MEDSVLLTNIRACELLDIMQKSCPELLREAASLIEEALNRTPPAVTTAAAAAPPVMGTPAPAAPLTAAPLRTPVQGKLDS